jgi:hypothetical protein
MRNEQPTQFEEAISQRAAGSVAGDFWHFLRVSKKWWLLPIGAALLMFGALMFLGGTAAAPFIYTLF